MNANENPIAQNELGRKLTTWADRIEPHTNKILGVGLIATVIIVAFLVLSRSTTESSSEAWTNYYKAETPPDLEAFAEANTASPAAAWAYVEAGQLRLNEGGQTALSNRADSNSSIRKAKADFEAALNLEMPPEIHERALLGLASANEYLCDGNTQPVIDAYQALLTKYPESVYRKWAEHRIEILKKPETAEFYAWYSKQDPKPSDRPMPSDGKSRFPDSGIPNLDLFNDDLMKDLKSGGATDSKPEEKPAEKTSEDEKKPAQDAPPSDAKPEAEVKDAPKVEAKPEDAAPPEGEKPTEPAAPPESPSAAEKSTDGN